MDVLLTLLVVGVIALVAATVVSRGESDEIVPPDAVEPVAPPAS